MSERNMTTTTQSDELRKQIEAVIERHNPRMWRTDDGPVPMSICSCGQSIPCDAYAMASALLEAVTALEWYGDMRHIFDSEPVDGPNGDEVQYGTYDDGIHARDALAAAAARLD